MKVIATAKGYSDQMREVGDEFEVPDNARGSWFKPVKEPKSGKGHKPDTDDKADEVDPI